MLDQVFVLQYFSSCCVADESDEVGLAVLGAVGVEHAGR